MTFLLKHGLLTATCIIGFVQCQNQPILLFNTGTKPEIKSAPPIRNVEALLNAIIFIESGGREKVEGDTSLKSPSVGILQIRKIMVDDCNRILKLQKSKKLFSYNDRYFAEKSKEMFYVWLFHYHENSSDEKIARTWNGGPMGHTYTSTIKYWDKVKLKLEQAS